jgi:hypothetical protein
MKKEKEGKCVKVRRVFFNIQLNVQRKSKMGNGMQIIIDGKKGKSVFERCQFSGFNRT